MTGVHINPTLAKSTGFGWIEVKRYLREHVAQQKMNTGICRFNYEYALERRYAHADGARRV